MAFKVASLSTCPRDRGGENLGTHLNAYTSREETVYESFCKDDPQTIDILQSPEQLKSGAIEHEVVFDHIHAVAFQESLAQRRTSFPSSMMTLRHVLRPTIPPTTWPLSVQWRRSWGFVKAMKKAFGMLPVSPNPNPLRCKAHPKPDFIGLESIFRNWVCALSPVSLLSSRLLDIIAKYNLAISYMFFSTSYSDTCLWGTYLVSENLVSLLYAPQVDPEEHRANSG
ncbi:hypothetical protein BGY98DRAFT_205018 [Russula aff. rugulosa BPL654]|nr:hypothetical protein BGY98DRAFT_205018 [Russula aff. rugulosa BPL654]